MTDFDVTRLANGDFVVTPRTAATSTTIDETRKRAENEQLHVENATVGRAMKNYKMLGSDARFKVVADTYLFASIYGRNVIHLHGITKGYQDHTALCGVVTDYNRSPIDSPDITFTVCAKCLREAETRKRGENAAAPSAPSAHSGSGA